ncbi:ABC transporter permease [Psychroflexus salarius]|nr:FtsX-like permease family protein [Psychroflexus salarius]
MNFPYFVSKRLQIKSDYKSSVSGPIIKIAITAIALGIIVMLIAFGTSLGLQTKIREKIAAFNGHVVITSFTSNVSKENLTPIDRRQSFYPQFSEVPEVSHIQATATKWGIIRTETDFEGVVLKGVDSLFNLTAFEEFISEGKFPELNSTRASDEIIISEYLAKRLQLKVSDRLVMYFMRQDSAKQLPRPVGFEIVGLYNSGFQDFDKTYVIGDLRQIQRLNNWEDYQIGQFEVFIDDFSNIDNVAVKIYESIGSFLNAKSIKTMYPSIFEWLKLFDINTLIILIIMILVAGINMITALLVLILERRQMIGVFKAIGASNWVIRKVFLYNAVFIMLKGLVIGNVIGIGLLLLQQHFQLMPLDASSYYVTNVPVKLNPTYIIGVNLGTLILCLLMLIVPTYIVAKISPVKALKFD